MLVVKEQEERILVKSLKHFMLSKTANFDSNTIADSFCIYFSEIPFRYQQRIG